MFTTPTSRRAFLNFGCATTATLLSASLIESVSAQTSSPPLRVLCSGPAGSIPDIVARRVAEQLATFLPGGVIVDDKPGAAGQISINALKQAPADGSTVLLAQGAIATVYPYLYAKLGYDPALDLKPVSMAVEATLALAVGAAVPDSVKTLPDFIEWTRRNPKLANFGSPGIGTLPHLLGAELFRQAKVEWQHVAYAGGPPALVELIGGQISSLILPEGLFRQHQATGKLRVLATSGAVRSAYLPAVPTFAELGFPELVMREWFAFFMLGRTPAETVEKMSNAMSQAISGAPVITWLADAGMTAVASTPSALADRIANEQKYWQRIIRTTGIKVE